MANLMTQKVVGDTPSQETAQLIHSYNQLLDMLGTLITDLKTAANIGAVNALAVTAEASMQTLVYKLQAKPNIRLNPAPALHT